MHASVRRCVIALALPVALCCCQLFGGSTQVRFDNATSSFTLTSIQFGSLTSGPLAAGTTTAYSPAVPGQNVLIAESQTGDRSTPVLFTIVAGHSYTVTLQGPSFSLMTATLTADN